jgi:glutamate-5-semialdehyde dehydrogenase
MIFREQFENALTASRHMNILSAGRINDVLNDIAAAAIEKTDYILRENKKDLDLMDPSDPKYDRLKLTKDRIASIAGDILNVAALPSPLGKVLSETVRPNGLKISKVRVPFGVIGIIYEARPNVTFDVFSLCLKSGNVCILKGGSDAYNSNKAIVEVIHKVLAESGIDVNALTLLPAGREVLQGNC